LAPSSRDGLAQIARRDPPGPWLQPTGIKGGNYVDYE
jgi:hypothetical protein